MIEASPPAVPGAGAGDPGEEHPRRRRRARLAVVAVSVLVGLLVCWAGYCAFAVLRAEGRLRNGVSGMDHARSELHLASITETSSPLPSDLASVQADFAGAHRLVGGPLLAPARSLPWLGVQLRSVDHLSGAAAEVASAGQSALRHARQLLAAAHVSPAQRLSVISEVAATTRALGSRLQGLSLGPARGLLPSLAAKRAVFATDLAKLKSEVRRAAGATAAVASMLDGHKTYLLLAANNAEMRDGSGMFLEAGTLSTDNGAVALGRLEPTDNLVMATPKVPVTGDLAARWGFAQPNRDYRNLALSPRFPANAKLAAAMWQAQTGEHVDGVVAVDIAALKDLLSATGPVKTPVMVATAANIEAELLVKEYAGSSANAKANGLRQQELASVATSIFKALQAPGVSLPLLAKALAEASAGRHLMMWSARTVSERRWVAAGASGRLGRRAMMLGVINLNGTKLDPYLAVTSRLSIVATSRHTRVQVVVTVGDHAPAGLPPYVAGRGGKGLPPPGSYDGAIALDFPGSAGEASVLGHARLEAAGADGHSTVLAAPVVVEAGTSVTRTFRFTLSGSHGSVRIEPSARIPPTTWAYAGKSFTDATAHTVRW